jgi:rRNA-processing protein FCF1
MVKRSEIGKLINQKLTGKEIRKQIKDFPENPDLSYFESLGYTEGTAKTYLSRFRKNEKTNSSYRTSNKLTSDSKQAKSRKTKYNDLDSGFFKTPNANSNSIIIDTCSVGYDSCLKIIFKAKKVTVVYSVIKELDSLNINNNSTLLGAKTRDIMTKLLEDESGKYRLVPYGYNDERQADDVIIDYLMSLPVVERPTLLTTDKNLSLKAKCLGLEYIFYKIYKNVTNNQEDPNLSKVIKKVHKPEPKPEPKELDKQEVKDSVSTEVNEVVETESNETVTPVEVEEIVEKQSKVEEPKTENVTEENAGPQNNHLGIDVKISWQMVEFERLNGDAEIFAMYENECIDVTYKKQIQTPDSIIIARRGKGTVSIHYMLLGNKEGIQVKKFTFNYVNELYASDLPAEVIEHVKNMF